MAKKGSGTKVAAPDPGQLAAQQAAANKEAVLESAKLSQINEITPYGTLRYLGGLGSPDRTRVISLPQDAQQLLNTQRRISTQLTAPAMARALDITRLPAFNLQGVPKLLGGEDLVAGAQPVEKATFERIMGLTRPALERRRHDIDTFLTTRGIPVGSEAWKRANREFSEQERDIQLNAARDAVLAGRGEQSRLFGLSQAARQQGISDRILQRTQPINEIAAALQGSPAIGVPNFGPTPQYGVAPPNIIGATGIQQQALQAQANRDAQAQQGLMSGLFGLGGSLGSAAILASARRFKNVGPKVSPAKAGDIVTRLPVHRWTYKGDATPHVGPMADDLAEAGVGDGTTLHVNDLFGLSVGAIQDMNKRLRKVERRAA